MEQHSTILSADGRGEETTALHGITSLAPGEPEKAAGRVFNKMQA